MRYLFTFAFCVFIQVVSFSQSADFIAARNAATAYIQAQAYTYNSQRNIWTSPDQTIQIFLFEDGNLLIGGYPTTATEKNKFQVHLFVSPTNNSQYLLEYAGSFEPTLNIQNGNTIVAAQAGPPVRLDFAILGPFTGSLQITLKRLVGTAYNAVASTTIKIAKTIHISIGSGLIFSSLRNPSNIKYHVLTNGDTTLLADDPQARGMLTLFATFYPGGRPNLYMPSKRFADHYGILVGTAINAGSSNSRISSSDFSTTSPPGVPLWAERISDGYKGYSVLKGTLNLAKTFLPVPWRKRNTWTGELEFFWAFRLIRDCLRSCLSEGCFFEQINHVCMQALAGD